MLDWQKDTAPTKAEIEKQARGLGIPAASVTDYFARCDEQAEECRHYADEEQYVRDTRNILAEQIGEIGAYMRSTGTRFDLSRLTLRTPYELGYYYEEIVD